MSKYQLPQEFESLSTEFPKFKYHKTHDAVMINNHDEEQFLHDNFPDEWKDTPAAFGIITAPGPDQVMQRTHGFSFATLKEKTINSQKAIAAANVEKRAK